MKASVLGLSFLIVLPALAQLPVLKVTVEQLVKESDRFDAKDVTTQGTVENFKQKTSARGNPYFTFRLVDKNQTVNVYSQGTAKRELKEKEAVTVTGVYRKEKRVGSSTFKNEIDITAKKDRDFGVKVSGVIQ